LFEKWAESVINPIHMPPTFQNMFKYLFLGFLFLFPSFSFADTLDLGSVSANSWVSSASGSTGYAPATSFLFQYSFNSKINLSTVYFPLTRHTAGVCSSSNTVLKVYSDSANGSTLGTLLGTSSFVSCSSLSAWSSTYSGSFDSLKQSYNFTPDLVLDPSVSYTFVFSADGGQYIRPAEPQSGSSFNFYYLTGVNWSSSHPVAASFVYTLYSDPVSGCTSPSAVNYNLLATIDDGSCVTMYEPFTGSMLLSSSTCALSGSSTNCQFTYATSSVPFVDLASFEYMFLFGLMFYVFYKTADLVINI